MTSSPGPLPSPPSSKVAEGLLIAAGILANLLFPTSFLYALFSDLVYAWSLPSASTAYLVPMLTTGGFLLGMLAFIAGIILWQTAKVKGQERVGSAIAITLGSVYLGNWILTYLTVYVGVSLRGVS